MKYLNEIFFILGKEKNKLPFILLFIILGSILDLMGLSIIGPFVMFLTNPEILTNKYETNFIISYISPYLHKSNFITLVGLIFVFIFILRTILTILIKYLILKFTLNLRVSIQTKLLKSYLKMPYISYTSKNSSYYVETITNLVASFTSSVSSIVNIVSELTIIMFIWIFLVIQNPEVTVIITVIISTLILIYDFLFKKKLRDYGQFTSEGSKKLLQSLVELINGFKEIKILGINNFFKNKVTKGANEIAKNLLKSGIISMSPRYFFELLLIIFFVTYSIFFSFNNSSTAELLPQLSIFALAALRILPAANQLTNNFLTVRFGRYASARLFENIKILEEHDKIIDNNISSDKNQIDFKNLKLIKIKYKYPNRNKIIVNDFNLTINKGEFIGIKGKTGSGKTTIIDLITGLLNPDEGKILLNNEPLNRHLKAWRNQLAYIPQQIVMIDDTIKANIALGHEENKINNEKLFESIKKAKLEEFINELPQGIKTIIGDRGIQISGGQRQRIALARAFYYNRDILILDESTNSLDKKTEIEILEQIKLLKGDKTIIIISHDSNCFKYCENVFEINSDK